MKRPAAQGLIRAKQEVAGAILYVGDAASFLACSEKAIRAKVDRQIIPYRRLGGRICFLRSELESFIETLPGTTLDEARANIDLRSGRQR